MCLDPFGILVEAAAANLETDGSHSGGGLKNHGRWDEQADMEGLGEEVACCIELDEEVACHIELGEELADMAELGEEVACIMELGEVDTKELIPATQLDKFELDKDEDG